MFSAILLSKILTFKVSVTSPIYVMAAGFLPQVKNQIEAAMRVSFRREFAKAGG